MLKEATLVPWRILIFKKVKNGKIFLDYYFLILEYSLTVNLFSHVNYLDLIEIIDILYVIKK